MMQTLEMSLAKKEQSIIERALPAHLMVLMLDECVKIGIAARSDLLHHLNVASAAPLSQLDTMSVARVAKRIDDAARSLLHDLAPDDPRDGLYVCAMFASVLVDEGRLIDPGNQAVLSALLILDEAKEDQVDPQGTGAVWGTYIGAWTAKARTMLFRAVLLGLYGERGVA